MAVMPYMQTVKVEIAFNGGARPEITITGNLADLKQDLKRFLEDIDEYGAQHMLFQFRDDILRFWESLP